MRSRLTGHLRIGSAARRRGGGAAAAAAAAADLLATDAGAATDVVPIGHEPPLAPRDEVIFLLHTAAEVEHALLVQYLYAAYSLRSGGGDDPNGALDTVRKARVDGWRETLKEIAREEMAHLISVQNVLRAIGGPLNFEREDFPFRGGLYPFPFRLEPLTRGSAAKYVFAEMPDSLVNDAALAPGVTVGNIREEASKANADDAVNHVGPLYARIIELVAALPPTDFAAASVASQAAPADWMVTAFQGMIIQPVGNQEDAVRVLGLIAEQGEGLGEPPAGGQPSHFRRFLAMYLALRDDPMFNPAVPVPMDPNTEPPASPDPAPAPPADPVTEALAAIEAARAKLVDLGRITHAESLLWAQLFNLRYRILLANLSHFMLVEGDPGPPDVRPAAPRGLLRDRAFHEMRVMARLAGVLTKLPRLADGGGGVAGPPFELPYTLALPDAEGDRWRLHRDMLGAAAGAGGLIARVRAAAGNLPPTDPRARLLADLERADTADRAEIDRIAPPPAVDITELRLLPPLAVARFGSADDPMDNYDVVPDDASGYRQLVPAPTLRVDRATGRIIGVDTPDAVRFRGPAAVDGTPGAIRPVAPFLEVWARLGSGGEFVPLTSGHLAALTDPRPRWRVRLGNLKAARRTGNAGDRITVDSGEFADHAVRPLDGQADNFKDGRAIRFGDVQFIDPTPDFPGVRLRFTPAAGRVYGPTAGDPNLNPVDGDVYDPGKGTWDTYNDDPQSPGTPPITVPRQIYARRVGGPNDGQSLAYVDDSCDGWVEFSLDVAGRTLTAFGRVSVAMPDFAPGHSPPRSVQDELDQMLHGPDVADDVNPDGVIELVRRALDTMELMYTPFWNDVYDQPYTPVRAVWESVRPIHHNLLKTLAGLRDPAGSAARRDAVDVLRLVRDRLREYREVGNETQAVRQKMPPFMRGSDAQDLALTRRQLSRVDRAIEQFGGPATPLPGATPEQAMLRLVQELGAPNASRHDEIVGDDGAVLAALFGNPPDVLNYLRTNTARGDQATDEERGKPLVVPGDSGNSAFFQVINRVGHTMRNRFVNYQQDGKNGIQIVREWIESL